MTLRAFINRGLAALGVPGVIGLGLIVFCVALYDSTIYESKQQLTEKEAKLSQFQKTSTHRSASPSAMGPLSDFYEFFPASSSLPQWLEKAYALAATEGLDTPQGEYRMIENPQQRIVAYQVVLPMRGTYPQLRRFVATTLNELPFVSLDDLRFERQRSEDAAVDAQVRLTFYLRAN